MHGDRRCLPFHTPTVVKVFRIVGLSLFPLLCPLKMQHRCPQEYVKCRQILSTLYLVSETTHPNLLQNCKVLSLEIHGTRFSHVKETVYMACSRRVLVF